MSLPYGPPAEVSPLIRGLRFGLLFAGIFYAFGKQKIYNNIEAARLEEEARKKAIKDKEIAKLKAKIAKEEQEAVRQLETGELFKTDEERAAEAEWRAKSAEPKIDVCPPKCAEPKLNPCPNKSAEPILNPCTDKCAQPEETINSTKDAATTVKPCPNKKQ